MCTGFPKPFKQRTDSFMVRIAGILSSAESDRMFACFRGKGTLKDLLIPSVKIPETVTSHDITPSSAKTGIREAHVYSRAGLKQAVHHSIRAGASYTGREAGKAQRKTESKKKSPVASPGYGAQTT